MGVYDMKLRDLVKNLEILECTAPLDTEISGVSYDSRVTRPGDLFVAIKGFEVDGHKFIPKAVERGAAAVNSSAKPRPRSVPARSRRTGQFVVVMTFASEPQRP